MKSFAVTILLVASNALAQTAPQRRPSEYPVATVREEQQIVVDGVPEIWRLQWTAVPKPYCEPSANSLMCPCAGFAFGEAGDLFLIRLRAGAEIERLHLTPLFEEEPEAVVQRWPVDYDNDLSVAAHRDFPSTVKNRPTVRIMHFADYDHDGNATEFYLQTEAGPCGKTAGVVIGVSAQNAHLHVFGTISHPTKPLLLQKREWEVLRDAEAKQVTIIDWPCGDHGAESETELLLRWSVAGLDGVRREYNCPSENEKRHLVREQPL